MTSDKLSTDRLGRLALATRPYLVLLVGGLLLVLGSILIAQTGRESLNTTTAPAPQGASQGGDCSPDEAKALLPTLPQPTDLEREGKSLLPGVSKSAPLSHIKIDPDEYKTLLGYSGPYYNTEQLDGRVLVLPGTVYTWPGQAWRITGMVRNQSCKGVHLTVVTARLLGSRGELLDTVAASLPIPELRPGEPVPFVTESAVQVAAVKKVEWDVAYTPSQTQPSRSFSFLVYREKQLPDSSTYSLFGSIRNLGSTIARNTHVVAAWLDEKGRVIYVASPQIRLANPPEVTSATNLKAADFEDFIYNTDDPSLVPLLKQAHLALWGVSN